MTTSKPCKDCKAAGRPLTRTAAFPGPRCYSCHHARKRVVKTSRREAHVEKTYGLTPEQLAAILAVQGGRCAICRRATGASKALAIDHDHQQALRDGHDPSRGCLRCTRGALCMRCNRQVLGHLRDDPAALQRAIDYLTNWPSRRAGIVP